MDKIDGLEYREETIHGLQVFHTSITTQAIAAHLDQAIGDYSVIQSGKLWELPDLGACIECVAECLRRYLGPYQGKPLLIIGIGDADSHFDSLGPRVVRNIPAHFMSSGKFPCAFKSVTMLAPGTFGQNNISVKRIISGMARTVNAACIVLIDTSCVSSFEDVGTTIRISNSGLTLYFSSERIGPKEFHTPVITISVPLVWSIPPSVSNMYHLSKEKTGIELTATNIALDLKFSVKVLARAIIRAVYPEINLRALNQLIERF